MTVEYATGRTPQGVRGLKPTIPIGLKLKVLSHSARSAWIETVYMLIVLFLSIGRTPQGVRGLKP